MEAKTNSMLTEPCLLDQKLRLIRRIQTLFYPIILLSIIRLIQTEIKNVHILALQ